MLTKEQITLLLEMQRAGIFIFNRETIQAKYGLGSPIYLDLRGNLYKRSDLIWRIGGEFTCKIKELSSSNLSEQGIVGVPDTATPLALASALYAWKEQICPSFRYILLRKEQKNYQPGNTSYIIGSQDSEDYECNLIDDVIASGLSKWKALNRLRDEGIKVNRIIVFLDRQQGGTELLAAEGYKVQSIFKLSDVIGLYLQKRIIDQEQHQQVLDFIQTHQFKEPLWA